MRFTHGSLIEAILNGAGSTEEIIRANAANFVWDERLTSTRVGCFQQDPFVPKRNRWDALVEGYATYYAERLEWDGRGTIPEPFDYNNDGARLEQLPDADRELVRVAKTGPVLTAVGLGQDAFKSAFDLHAASAPDADDPPVLDARAVLQRFVTSWNAYDRRPPAFVGFALDVEDELGSPDVFTCLRDRFGMGKLHVPSGAAPTPVMLLRYRVKDVLRAAKPFCAEEAAICIPTVLESNFYEYFYPAPTPLPFGRTVNLNGKLDETKLTCELIHLPVDLKLEQIVAVGHIATPIPNETLSRVRDVHLYLIRYETGRDDFGEYMSGHEPS